MSSHLIRRGGIWWVRLVVPARLRNAAVRQEFNQSCQTHELATAKLVASVLLADWRKQLLQLDSLPISLSVLKIVGGSPILFRDGWAPLAEVAGLSGISQDQLLRASADGTLNLFCRLPQVRGVLADGFQRFDIVAFVIPGQPGKLFAPDTVVSVTVEKLEVLANEVDAIRQGLASSVPEDAIQHAQELQKAALQGAAHSAGKQAHKRFSEALAEFAKHELPQSNKNPKEIERIRAGIGLFDDLVGNLKLSEIDSD